MAGATNRKERLMLNAALDVSGYSIALYTTMPADDGSGGTEVTGGSYARVSIASTDWEDGIQGNPTTKSGPKTGVSWTFPAPSANWGNVKGIGIVDGSSNIDFIGLLPTAKDINNGDPAPVFNVTHQILVQFGDPGDTF
jgi:hypothetical protein